MAVLTWPAIHWLFWPGYLSTYDGIYHLTRMIEVDSLVRHGVFYPRWFPDFGLSHGYPIFNFFPPFGYLLTELFTIGNGSVALAIQISMAVSFVVSGWGMYLLTRELCAGRLASVALAAFYVYFPYHVQDAYTRGGMPELWAMAWLPWLAWAQLRATREARPVWIGLAGLLGALEVGSHNILAVFILPLSLALSLLHSRRKRPAVLAACASSGLGLLLSTGYWLPAVVEAPLTHVKALAGDWLPNHTYWLPELIDPLLFAPYGSQTYKMTALEAGILAVVLALLGWRAWKTRERLPLLGLIGLILLTVFGLTRWSVPLWTNLPLLGYIQFPWRLLMVVGFLMAAGLAALSSWRQWTWLPLAVLAAVVGWTTLAQVPDNRFATAPPLDARSLETQEYGSALDGVAIESEYQPQTSSQDLVKASQGKRLPPDTSSLPPLSVQGIGLQATALQLQLSASQPTELRLQSLYFPGWTAQLDGRSWPLRPATPAGFVDVQVPEGSHRLEVSYSGTPLEGIAGVISGFALLGTAAWCLRKRRWSLAGLVVLAGAVTVLVLRPPISHAPLRPLSWTPAAGSGPAPGNASARLVSASVPAVTQRGIQADLVWLLGKAEEPSFDFVLRDGSGREVRRVPSSQAATLRYDYVAANELLQRHYTLTAPLGVAAGRYDLALEANGSSADLGEITVPEAETYRPLDAVFQGSAQLSGYAVHRIKPEPGLVPDDLGTTADAALYPGDFLRVNLLWKSLQGIDQNYVTFVHLIDVSGKAWTTHDNQPNATLQATSSWVPGQTIRDDFLLHLPDDAPPGLYRIEVGLYHVHEDGTEFLTLPNGGKSAIFGAVKVRPRSAAAMTQSIAAWSEPISLEGWRQAPSTGGLAITFDWRATGDVSRDYTLFVHLSDSSGKVVAQADSPPQSNLYPTHLWETGDRISDTHVVPSVPPGDYRLSVGWYRADTGQRLPRVNGQDELDLGAVHVP
ncbi:MAG TPA: 6-pyruvoyl-tetrahydropterin synthase-related protein [Chloroflexota bacterium]|nr:6-pyruvoyl-tetrahydropterin synthase-related protein [Chloroflexota bacterium]